MNTDKLDDVDLKILSLLRQNGRMTNVDLAKQVNLSPPPSLRRLKALEESSIILGYKAVINYQKLGYSVGALIVVRLNSQLINSIHAFCEKFKILDSVISCYSTIGNAEVVMYVVAKDIEEYRNFLSYNLQSDTEIKGFESFIISNTYKSGSFLFQKNDDEILPKKY